MLVRDTFSFTVRLQVPIDKLASLVSTEKSSVSIYLRMKLFTEGFHEARCIRLFIQDVHLRVAYLVFDIC